MKDFHRFLFTKTLNYKNFSWIIFCVKMSWYAYLYLLLTRKISNIHKDFEIYQVFMHNFLSQYVLIFWWYILLTMRIDTFWSESIKIFWPGDIATVWHRKSSNEKSVIFTIFFELHQLFANNFLCQTVPTPKLLSAWVT